MLKIKRKVCFDVKSTIINVLLEVLSPNRCQRCGLQGESLCGRCKKYLLGTNPGYAISGIDGFSRVIVGGVKEGLLSVLLKQYKYQGRRDLAHVLARKVWEVAECELFETSEMGEVVIVPLPTIRRHIRELGFDQMIILARELCRMGENLKLEPILERLNKTVQVGKSAKVRCEQAKQAYGVKKEVKLREDVHYVLFDDVWTTGSSMRAAAEVMRNAGACKISALVLMSNDYIES